MRWWIREPRSSSLPKLIEQLGLLPFSSKNMLSSNGVITKVPMYDPVRLTIQGRDCTIDELEVPDNVPVLIGTFPSSTSTLSWTPRTGP